MLRWHRFEIALARAYVPYANSAAGRRPWDGESRANRTLYKYMVEIGASANGIAMSARANATSELVAIVPCV
jgi:hypothetical protein